MENNFNLNWRMGVRVSAGIVSVASKFSSTIAIHHGGLRADAKSLMTLLLLSAADPAESDAKTTSAGLPAGSQIRLQIDGPDAAAAMDALSKIFRSTDPFF